MKKYAAFLRGINVGNIRIKMPDLKAMFESLGCKNVKTYLQSGNVVFDSDKTLAKLKPLIESALSETFKYEAYVLLYEFDTLAEFIAGYPFSRDEAHHAYCIFVEGDAAFKELQELSKTTGEQATRIKFGSGVIYWKVIIGETLQTPFSKIMAKAKFKSTTTNRNINTLEKMVEGG